MAQHFVVYGLSDPRTNELRYVGKTTQTLHRRLLRHVAPSYLKEATYKNNWLRGVYLISPAIATCSKYCVAPSNPDSEARVTICWMRGPDG